MIYILYSFVSYLFYVTDHKSKHVDHVVCIAFATLSHILVIIIIIETYQHPYNVLDLQPNFVHSLDSSHLCMTINDCDASILPIHDSFATHPCDVQKMHTALRKTFADMYSTFSTETFTEFNSIDTTEYPIPERGNLDISEVLDAPYMFC